MNSAAVLRSSFFSFSSVLEPKRSFAGTLEGSLGTSIACLGGSDGG